MAAMKQVAKPPFQGYDRARFYPVDNKRFPSVTTFLGVIDKPALPHWYAKQERLAFEEAILALAAAAEGGVVRVDGLLDRVAKAVSGVKAADKAKQKAADIGTAAHAWIEWKIKQMLGKVIGPEPEIPEPAQVSVMHWQDWAKEVNFKPLRAEITLVSRRHGYAGTADWIGYVNGVLELGDNKTSKGVYPEMYLQNWAYRMAAVEMGSPPLGGRILRLPKSIDNPDDLKFEAAPVPKVDESEVLAALTLWRCMRRLEGKPVGDLGDGRAAPRKKTEMDRALDNASPVNEPQP